MHFDHLDDFFQYRSVRPLFGFPNGADGVVEQPALVLEYPALHSQGVGQREGVAIEQGLDLLQRDAEKLERHDLLQPLQIVQAVEPIAGTVAPGLQEPEPVIVVQGADRDPGQLSELLYLE